MRRLFGFLILLAWAMLGVARPVNAQQEVSLRVRIAEINRASLRHIDLNFFESRSGLDLLRPTGVNYELIFPIAESFALGDLEDLYPFRGGVGQGPVARILSAPRLQTRSGQSGEFFSGLGKITIAPIAGIGEMTFNGTRVQLVTPDNQAFTIDDAKFLYGKGGAVFSFRPVMLWENGVLLKLGAEVSGFFGGAIVDTAPQTQIDPSQPVVQVPGKRDSSAAGGLDVNFTCGMELRSGIVLQATAGYMLLASDVGTGISSARDAWTVGVAVNIPYVSRLFRTSSSTSRDLTGLHMFLTPRIIIQEEEEE